MNITYLHVVTGKQSGSFIELATGNSYMISNDYELADIYLDTDTEFSLELFITAESVNFGQYTGDISLPTGMLALDQAYSLPQALNIDGVWIIFSPDEEISQSLIDELTTVQQPEVQMDEEVLDSQPDSTDLEFSPLNADLNAAEVADDASISEFNAKITARYNLKMFMDKVWTKSKYYGMQAFYKLVDYWKIFRQKFGIWSYFMVGGIALLILVLLIVMYQFRSQSITDNTQLNNLYVQQSINEELTKLPKQYANLKCSKQDGKFLITGIVMRESDIATVSDYFKPWLSLIKFQVFSFDTVKQVVMKTLIDNQIMVPNVWFNKSLGTIAISGIIGNNKSLDDIAIAISSQYPLLGDMDTSKVYTASDLDSQIDGLVKTKAEQITVDKEYAKGIVNLTGYVTDDDNMQIESKVKSFNLAHAGVIKINTHFQNILKALPFGITEVYTGNPAWLQTDDGVKLYVGGDYKGVTLVSIDKDKIVFRGSNTFVIMLSQLLSGGLSNQSSSMSSSGCCDRESILKQEYSNKLHLIDEEQKQLQDLQKILPVAKDPELRKSLLNTINNLTQDIEFRKKEVAYYQGGKQ